MKRQVQATLKRLGLYERLRASRVYDAYWWVADKRIIEDRAKELAFYRRLLPDFEKGNVIFDVGANHGAKTDLFLRLGARVVAVEPDGFNAEVLRQKFLSYRLVQKQLVILRKALSDRNGVETMWVDGPGSAKNTLSRKWVDTLRADDSRFGQKLEFGNRQEVATTTLDDLVRAHGRPYFIKIDVEGFEPTVLRGLTQAVPNLSFEVNLPEFRPEGLECLRLLDALDPQGRFNYAIDCREGLALNTWGGAAECSRLLNDCREPSIEIFWKASPAALAEAARRTRD
jgi:FkbM family methyltransferase